MLDRGNSFPKNHVWHCVAMLVVACAGCQQTGGGTPWQSNAQQPLGQAPSQVNLPNPFSGIGSSPSNSDPLSQPNSFLKDLMSRQSEQSRLADLQRRELARLTELYKAQTEKLAGLDREKVRDDRLELAKKLQKQTAELRQKEEELKRFESVRRRALEMDSDNRDLQKQLAQSQQQSRLYQDQLKVMRQQLDETANRLAETMQSQQQIQQQADQQVAALQANLQKQATLQQRSGATITANSSARPLAAAVQIAGLNVRQDGDVVRIELPSDQVFMPGTATINPEASPYLAQVANAIRQYYPRQKIGIEAHTDNSSVPGNWRNSHHLSAAQAMAVFEQFSSIHQFNPHQMHVLGHGPNHAVASNNTSDGKRRNRRVEVVIYPRQFD